MSLKYLLRLETHALPDGRHDDRKGEPDKANSQRNRCNGLPIDELNDAPDQHCLIPPTQYLVSPGNGRGIHKVGEILYGM